MQRLLRDQRGVTLIELVVAVGLSTIVIFAATTVIVYALNVTRQVTGRMTAAAEGRTGIETLLGQLNSGCLVNSDSPVLASTAAVDPSLSPVVSSDAQHLVFTTGLGDSTNPTPVLHVVDLNSNGALLDYAYSYSPGQNSNLGTPGSWLFSSTPSQILNLAEHVTNGTGTMFSYVPYNSGTDSLQGATPITSLPLTTTSAATVSEVDLDFVLAPPGATFQANQTSELQDSAVFSLTAQDNSAPNGPCQ